MAPSAMGRFLAAAAKQLREDADRRRYEVASSSTDRLDPSSLYRFEQGRWPNNPDRVVDLYAEDLKIEPVEIWALALELWRSKGDAILAPDGPEPREPSPEEEADAVIQEAERDAEDARPDAGGSRGQSGAAGRATQKRARARRRGS